MEGSEVLRVGMSGDIGRICDHRRPSDAALPGESIDLLQSNSIELDDNNI
jgi:hypothetical protein